MKRTKLPPPVLELPPRRNNARNSEGSFITLNNGFILFIYTKFGGGHRDHSEALLASRVSHDGGKTWSSRDQVVVPNEGTINVMSVSLLRLQDRRIGLFYLVKNAPHDCHPRVRFSEDEARTWSKPLDMVRGPSRWVINNDRVIQLNNGRLIAPAAHNRFRLDATNAPDGKGLLLPLISDDAGKSWRESKTWWPLPVHAEGGLQEPGMIELKDGRLFCWSRSTVGCQWGSWSADQGDTWTLPQPTEFKSPKSPLSMKRISSTGDLLAIWNDHSGRYPVPPYDLTTSWARSPLVSAISRDETLTWQNHKLIEHDASRGYCYTAIHFTDDDHVLLAYCNGGRDTGGWVLARTIIRRVPIKWFYT